MLTYLYLQRHNPMHLFICFHIRQPLRTWTKSWDVGETPISQGEHKGLNSFCGTIVSLESILGGLQQRGKLRIVPC